MVTKKDMGFYWIAKFSDDSIIAQYDKKGNEVLYREVLDNPLTLKEFKLMSSEEDEEYVVNLDEQKITTPYKNYNITGSNPELIYFRRNDVRMEVGGSGSIMPPRVVHHLGLKTTTQEQKFEIFKGLGQKPRKVEHFNVKTDIRTDLTDDKTQIPSS